MESEDSSHVTLRFRIAIAAVACSVLLLVLFALSARGPVAQFACTNAPLGEAVAPDGSRRAVWFVRDCGRRVPRSTQLSVLPLAEALGRGQLGNVFVAELEAPGQIEVRWAAADVLEIRVGPIRRAYRADPGIGPTRVLYGRLP